MAIQTFDDYLKKLKVRSVRKDLFDTRNMYRNYIHWLICFDKSRETVPVNELLFQLQIIAAYVEYTLKQHENSNADTIELEPVTEDIKNPEFNLNAINSQMESGLLTVDKDLFIAVKNAAKKDFESEYIQNVVISGILTAVEIGSAFIAQLPAAASIALLILGAASALVTLHIAYVRYNADTSTPEIAFGDQKDLYRNSELHIQKKHDAIESFLNNPEPSDLRICKDISAAMGTANDRWTDFAVRTTVGAAVHTRFAPMYTHVGAKGIDANNGSTANPRVNLEALRRMLKRPS